MTREETLELAQKVEEYILDLSTKNCSILSSDNSYKTILQSLKKLENRSREYKNPSFVVLVVGPVKAGKSTFVNLVANNYVSPTHFLECTIRPSIISSGEPNNITIYHSNDKKKGAEQMDDILDCLNGLIEKEAVPNISTEEVKLTKDNIDRYVKGGITYNDDIILTSIKTSGGSLIQDNVFLVDMPGFDGAKANFDNINTTAETSTKDNIGNNSQESDNIYATIVKRADLIIFVQSSNSAIAKVSSNFFDFLRVHNTSAPVCLIHNVFEAAFWRSDEQKKRDIEEQKQYAIDAICRKQLILEEKNTFNLNLGMVNDLRSDNYESHKHKLEEENLKFEAAEKEMYELFKRREKIRIINCISRTNLQKEELLKRTEAEIDALENELNRYKTIESEFDKLKIKEISPNFDSVITTENLKDGIVRYEYEEIKRKVNKKEFNTDEARGLAKSFLSKVQVRLNEYINNIIKNLNSLELADEIQNRLTRINVLAATYKINRVVQINISLPEYTVEFNPDIDLEKLIPSYFWWFNNHSKADVAKQLKEIYTTLYGFVYEETNVHHPGYVETKIKENMYKILETAKKLYVQKLSESINSEINKLKELALSKATPNISALENKLKYLREFRTQTTNLNIQVDE